VYEDVDRPVLVAEDEGGKLGVHELTGTITVRNPHRARKTFTCEVTQADIRIHEAK